MHTKPGTLFLLFQHFFHSASLSVSWVVGFRLFVCLFSPQDMSSQSVVSRELKDVWTLFSQNSYRNQQEPGL